MTLFFFKEETLVIKIWRNMEPARQFSEKRHFINPMGQSSVPQTYMVEGKDYLKVSSDFHIYAVVCVLHAHTHIYHTQNKC